MAGQDELARRTLYGLPFYGIPDVPSRPAMRTYAVQDPSEDTFRQRLGPLGAVSGGMSPEAQMLLLQGYQRLYGSGAQVAPRHVVRPGDVEAAQDERIKFKYLDTDAPVPENFAQFPFLTW